MPVHKADSNKLGYGVCAIKNGYKAKLALPEGTTIQKNFSSLMAAKTWQVKLVVREWGLERFALMKRGRLSILRKFGCGVSVRKTTSKTKLACGGIAEYPIFGVFWYDHECSPKSKFFSRKRYGDDAEIEANWFAAQQRARLTASELNLPEFLTPASFDLTEYR